MKAFLDENFLLQSKTAQELYHQFSKKLPIIDYHNHLIPEQIANDTRFDNISQVWLNGDHYKWRAMRTNGVNEKYITGDASDKDKFLKWAETVPYTMRNPLYHWTHLELQRYFGITELLSPKTAEKIYEETAEKLAQPQYSVRGLLKMMNVEVVCTTDDPIDSLNFHQQFAKENESFKMLPAFRPDKAMNTDDIQALNAYIDEVERVTNTSISSYNAYLDALKSRHDFFAQNGCSVSDHGLEQIYAEDYTDQEISSIFEKIRMKQSLSAIEQAKFKSAMLVQFAEWDHEKGWVQQYHLGALRNNNTRMLRVNGPDTGWDSIGDFSQARALSKFLNRLDNQDRLTKTILYNLNPADNELMATMVGNFNDGSIKGKIQFGSAWWFLDQKDGMTKQINALSNMGLLSRLVGMLTDSRSFLSFPRHEYFRRLICDIFGQDVENGELPNDLEWIGKLVSDISYNNAKEYFNF
ncbi:D-glucuronate isomerase [Sphingobacterium allocomposti]|jgi:glucuronate isomerase|uniref:Uronate isomerase n=1 Tax=Sphingobacterium allocomposti TaxID=415956 RepID=A0A5S5D2T1_9SPHI|nr:glucuronate isomerase [Sphingobacterium composti Yoo et al. 2007 non Ten et al. 2007]TYP90261.1 D-glucuronate isomerase [Sphingobacterium composti Yoo et al. 2007 non Ten et al. 2007]HLS95581.1 glucuronate isomerase [Sphingobacterium sp.]